MRKVFILYILIIPFFALPLYVNAVWWKPSTWFKKTITSQETKTEVLEKRIAELESKLASSTKATATSTPKENAVANTAKIEIKKAAKKSVVQAEPKSPTNKTQTQNFNFLIINHINTQIALDEELSKMIDPVISYVNIDTQRFQNLVNKTEGVSGEFANLLLNYYQSDLSTILVYKKIFENEKVRVVKDISMWKGLSSTASKEFFTMEQANSHIGNMLTFNTREEIENNVMSRFKEYKENRQESEEFLEEVFKKAGQVYTEPSQTSNQFRSASPARTDCYLLYGTLHCETY